MIHKLINISEGTSLAFHGLAMIAQGANETPPDRVNIKTMATKLEASENHLAKVFQKLGKAGIVSSVRGPSGGFILVQPPENISLLSIYEILEGKTDPEGCPLGWETCNFEICIFEDRMHKANREIYEILKDITLLDYTK